MDGETGEEDEDEEDEGEGEGKGEQEETEDDEENYNNPPCDRCRRGARKCQKRPGGTACLTCNRNKYKCEYPKDGVDVKGKRRQGAERKTGKDANEGGAGRQGPKQMEPEVKVEVKPNRRAAKKPVAKPALKKSGRAPPKYIEVSGEEDEEEDPQPQPKPKRARARTYNDRAGE